MAGPEVKITEEDKRIPFQIQTVQEHTLRAIQAITKPVNPDNKKSKFIEAQKQFEETVSN